jgi:hypothetical protein
LTHSYWDDGLTISASMVLDDTQIGLHIPSPDKQMDHLFHTCLMRSKKSPVWQACSLKLMNIATNKLGNYPISMEVKALQCPIWSSDRFCAASINTQNNHKYGKSFKSTSLSVASKPLFLFATSIKKLKSKFYFP